MSQASGMFKFAVGVFAGVVLASIYVKTDITGDGDPQNTSIFEKLRALRKKEELDNERFRKVLDLITN